MSKKRTKKQKKQKKAFSREQRLLGHASGTVMMGREGCAFVREEGKTDSNDDIYVNASNTRGALNGDKVYLDLISPKSPKHHREGRVVEILERSRKPFVGILHTTSNGIWVLMQSKVMPYDISIDPDTDLKALGAVKGMKVAALVDGWHPSQSIPYGHIVDVLGYPGENDTEMHCIMAEYGLPYRFDPEVEKAAAAIPVEITEKDRKERKDFTSTFTFTIDPTDAKDFDDALSFKNLGDDKYEVGVHIADVSHYVTPGSIIDKQARERGTSVYLVDRTVPMLPEALSNNLCSLRPGEEKLVFSAVFKLDANAKVIKKKFCRSIIKSDHRLDYAKAQDIILNGCEDPLLQEALQTLNKLAGCLKAQRMEAGAINFDRPETKVIIDEKGRPIDVVQKISEESNFLIEEFMLLANRNVAEWVGTHFKLPFVYRIHDVPDPDKFEVLRTFAKGFGHKMEKTSDSRSISKSINALLEEAKGTPEADALSQLSVRSMAKARYSTENIGHYGLAFDWYTHFTSPIRRYPDVMVHRILASCLEGGAAWNKDALEEECKWSSEREIVAAEAERASVKYKIVEFMQDKVGAKFDGHISGLTDWGMYVAIEPSGIEGMIALRDIHSDFYEFDPAKYRLVGRTTHKIFRLGDKVTIKVAKANLEKSELDFELLKKIPRSKN